MRHIPAFLLWIMPFCITNAQNPHDTLYSPEITKLTNGGNGYRRLELTDFSRNYIATNYFANPVYKGNKAPIQVSVYDWNTVIPGDYRLEYDSISLYTTWKMYRIGTVDTVYSDSTITQLNHQYIPQWGLVVTVFEDTTDRFNGPWIDYTFPDTSYIDYNGSAPAWISGMEDIDGHPYQDWILSGTQWNDILYYDTSEIFENILYGTFSFHKLVNIHIPETSPWDTVYQNVQGLIEYRDLPNIDLVLTSDTSLWSRCPVLNIADGMSIERQQILDFPSLGKDGNPDNSGTFGMSWFPGYVIDLDCGERLNIAFGENRMLTTHNGTDGLFNPDSVRYDGSYPVFGGQHWIYIYVNQKRLFPSLDRMPGYDEGNYLYSALNGTSTDKVNAWRSCTWLGSIMPEVGHSFLESNAILKIRKLYGNTIYRGMNLDSVATFQFNIPQSMPTYVKEMDNTEVLVFPNPSTGKIIVALDKKYTSVKSVIYNLYGKEIFSTILFNHVNYMDLSSLTDGVYILQLELENGVIQNTKIIIQK